MKIFQITQKNLAALGFIPNQNKPHHFNKHHVRAIFIAALTIGSEHNSDQHKLCDYNSQNNRIV